MEGDKPKMEADKSKEISPDKFWESVSMEVGERFARASDLVDSILNMRVEAMATMIEFASVHGTNFRHFQDNSDANNNDATKDIAEPEFKEK